MELRIKDFGYHISVRMVFVIVELTVLPILFSTIYFSSQGAAPMSILPIDDALRIDEPESQDRPSRPPLASRILVIGALCTCFVCTDQPLALLSSPLQ